MNARALATALVLAMAVAGTLAGCGGSSGSDRSKEARDTGGWRLPDQPDRDVRDKMEGLFAGVGVRIAATEELSWRCMTKKGVRYVKRPAPKRDGNPTMSAPDYGISPAEAGRHGYRTAALLNESENQPNPYKDQTPAERQRWGQAFFGPDSAPQIRVKLPGGSEVETSSQGCLADAQKQVFGSIERMLKSESFAGNLPAQARNRANADPRMRKLNALWSACMTKQGHAGLADPALAHSKAAESYRNGDRRTEIKIAVADATCEQQIHYAPQRKRLEDLYYTAALHHYEPEIAAVYEMNKGALARARTVLAGRTP
ncbi:MAG: hypothetical protein JWO67_6903 [Streptosporangiaceae bacterium]|jgi:hypothetical protein|nr:hypothetical protein [Streptosporangiaceae bacterium]